MTAIHIKFPALTLKAGPRALARIRQQGLHPREVGTLPGAAGGPKALGIQGLDLALLLFCSLAMARDLDQDEALRLRQQGVILPLEQLLKQAMDRYPGAKLLEAELEEKHDVYIYEVELLTVDGVVRELDLEAATGRLLKDEEDD